MSVSRAVRAATTDMTGLWRNLHHERGCRRDSLSSRAGLWELAGVLERTRAGGIKNTQGLKPGDES